MASGETNTGDHQSTESLSDSLSPRPPTKSQDQLGQRLGFIEDLLLLTTANLFSHVSNVGKIVGGISASALKALPFIDLTLWITYQVYTIGRGILFGESHTVAKALIEQAQKLGIDINHFYENNRRINTETGYPNLFKSKYRTFWPFFTGFSVTYITRSGVEQLRRDLIATILIKDHSNKELKNVFGSFLTNDRPLSTTALQILVQHFLTLPENRAYSVQHQLQLDLQRKQGQDFYNTNIFIEISRKLYNTEKQSITELGLKTLQAYVIFCATEPPASTKEQTPALDIALVDYVLNLPENKALFQKHQTQTPTTKADAQTPVWKTLHQDLYDAKKKRFTPRGIVALQGYLAQGGQAPFNEKERLALGGRALQEARKRGKENFWYNSLPWEMVTSIFNFESITAIAAGAWFLAVDPFIVIAGFAFFSSVGMIFALRSILTTNGPKPLEIPPGATPLEKEKLTAEWQNLQEEARITRKQAVVDIFLNSLFVVALGLSFSMLFEILPGVSPILSLSLIMAFTTLRVISRFLRPALYKEKSDTPFSDGTNRFFTKECTAGHLFILGQPLPEGKPALLSTLKTPAAELPISSESIPNNNHPPPSGQADRRPQQCA